MRPGIERVQGQRSFDRVARHVERQSEVGLVARQHDVLHGQRRDPLLVVGRIERAAAEVGAQRTAAFDADFSGGRALMLPELPKVRPRSKIDWP